MRKAALAALLLVVLVPSQAKALDTEELLGLVAMPLAVAAASEVTGVPVGDLSHFVATLNRAEVPSTQVVQVVRYAPAALVVEDQQPTFLRYVDTQVDQGVMGSQLVTVIEDRYRTYDLQPQFVALNEPATTYVVRDDYIPEVVITRMAQVQPVYVAGDTNDLLALAAMPLAVAAVAEMTGVPYSDLSSFVATLNAAHVPPLQVVEVLRYVPVALADDAARPQFVQFVNTQVADGVTGTRLVDAIGTRLRTYDMTPAFGTTEVVNVVEDAGFFPAAVTSRVAAVRSHPHGGPPGQLKKQIGVQTGAEVVHGRKPGRDKAVRAQRADRAKPARVAVRGDRDRSQQQRHVVRELPQPPANRVIAPPAPKPDRGQGGGHGQGHGKGHGQGGGQGKDKDKGKGKG